MAALCLGFRKGQFWIATDVPQLKGFASDPQVQESFLRHMQAAFNNSSQSVQQAHGQAGAISDEDDDMPPEDSSQFRVVDLRKMVLKAVMKDGRSKPGWGKQAFRPAWWPTEVDFTDVNNSSKRPRIEQLVSIMDSYRRWITLGQAEDCDMAVDNHPHSPKVPIPASSTPAAGLMPVPPSSPPGFFPSPIHPRDQVVTHNPVEVPASRVRPPVGFTDIVKRRFGSDSVYCTEQWQPVLETCKELNQTQRSKMLCILGKLNEDAETHTIIKVATAKEI